MSIPNYICDKHLIEFNSLGTWCCGYTLEFINDKPFDTNQKVFLKIVALCDIAEADISTNNIYFNNGEHSKIQISTFDTFENEIIMQNELYEKTMESPICPKILDHFILNDYNEICSLFNLLMKAENNIIDKDILYDSIYKRKNIVEFGVIVMEFLDGVDGYKFFGKYITKEQIFGKFFNAKLLIEQLNDNLISEDLFVFLQILYRDFQMFNLNYIHNDLHLGNIYISQNKFCCNKECKELHKLSHIYKWRVYIIDFAETERIYTEYTESLTSQDKMEELKIRLAKLGEEYKEIAMSMSMSHDILSKFPYDWFYNFLYEDGKVNTSIISKLYEYFNIDKTHAIINSS